VTLPGSAVSPLRGREIAPFVLAAVFVMLAAVWLDRHGVGVSRDAAYYLGVAFELRFRGLGLSLEPAYPLGYPLLVAQAMRFEPFALDAARWVSLASYALTLFSAAALFRRVSGPLVASLAVGVLATMLPVVAAHGYALSDAPFGALVALHVFLVVRHAESRHAESRGVGWLAGAAAVAGLATVVRVIGYATICVFTCYVLWQLFTLCSRRSERLRLLAAHSLCYLPPAAIAVATAVSGQPVHGNRGGSTESLGLNIERALATFGADLGVALLAPILLAGVLFSARRWRATEGLAPPSPAFVYSLSMVVLYVVAVVAAATLTKVSPVGSRFFAPYYGLALLLAVAPCAFVPERWRRGVAVGLAVALLSVLVPNVRQLLALDEALNRVARGSPFYFQQGFRSSPSRRALRDFVTERARGAQSASISTLSPLAKRGHHEDGGRALFFTRAAVAPDGEPVRFAWLDRSRFRIWLADAPEAGGLLYVRLGLDSDDEITAESTLEAVIEVMIAERRPSHWLLVPARVDPLVHIESVLGAPLRIAEKLELGAYRAYRFEIVRS